MTKITPEQQIFLDRIGEDRADIHNWEVLFQARIRQMRETETNELNRKLTSDMWHAREAGASIATIGEYYNTKDRATISRKIAEYQTIVDVNKTLSPGDLKNRNKNTFAFEIDVDKTEVEQNNRTQNQDPKTVYRVVLKNYREIDHDTNLRNGVDEITGTGWWIVSAEGYVTPHFESYYDRAADATYYELNVMTQEGSRLQQYAQAWLDTQR